jgi:hypothetical protein
MRAPFARYNRELKQAEFGQGDVVSIIERDDLPEAMEALFNTLIQTMPQAGKLQRWQKDHLFNLHRQLSLYLGQEPSGEAQEVEFEVHNRGVFGLRPIRNDKGHAAYLFVAGNQVNDRNRPLEKWMAFQADPYLAGEWVLAMAEQLLRGMHYRDHARKLYDLAGTVIEQGQMALGAWGWRSGLMGAVHVAAMERTKPQWHPELIEDGAIRVADISAELRNRVFGLESRPAGMGALDYEAELHANADILAKARAPLRSAIRKQIISRVEAANAANIHKFAGDLRNQDEFDAHFVANVRALQAGAADYIGAIWAGVSSIVVNGYAYMASNPDLLPPLVENDVNKMCSDRLAVLIATCFEHDQPYVSDVVLRELDNLIDILWDVAARNCLYRNRLSAIVIGGPDHLTYANLSEQYIGSMFLVPCAEPRDRV